MLKFMSCSLLNRVLLVFAWLPFTLADYYIDDANSSVQYTGSSSTWGALNLTMPHNLTAANGTAVVFDYARIFDQTLYVEFWLNSML